MGLKDIVSLADDGGAECFPSVSFFFFFKFTNLKI